MKPVITKEKQTLNSDQPGFLARHPSCRHKTSKFAPWSKGKLVASWPKYTKSGTLVLLVGLCRAVSGYFELLGAISATSSRRPKRVQRGEIPNWHGVIGSSSVLRRAALIGPSSLRFRASSRPHRSKPFNYNCVKPILPSPGSSSLFPVDPLIALFCLLLQPLLVILGFSGYLG